MRRDDGDCSLLILASELCPQEERNCHSRQRLRISYHSCIGRCGGTPIEYRYDRRIELAHVYNARRSQRTCFLLSTPSIRDLNM